MSWEISLNLIKLLQNGGYKHPMLEKENQNIAAEVD